MTSKELWKLLEKSTTQDIQTMVFMSVMYLEKNRNVPIKEQIKDIKHLKGRLEKEN